MYLVSIYFDEHTNKVLNRYIKGICECTGNSFMIDNNVPGHITVLSIEAPSKDVLMEKFDAASKNVASGDIIIPSIGQLLPYVIYAAPVMNEYLLELQQNMINAFSDIEGVSISKYYSKNSWMPHVTLGKTLDEKQMKSAFEYLQKHFLPFEAKVEKIGLAKTNPHEDLLIREL